MLSEQAGLTMEESRSSRGSIASQPPWEALSRLPGGNAGTEWLALRAVLLGLAHDFNNVLQTMLSSSILLGQKLHADHPGQAHIRALEDAVQRAAGLSTKLRAYSNSLSAPRTVVDLNTLLTDVLRLLRQEAGERLRLELRTAQEPAWVDCSVPAFLRMLVDMCQRAAEAGRGEADLLLAVRKMNQEGRERVLLAVRGRGFEGASVPEGVQELHEPLERLRPFLPEDASQVLQDLGVEMRGAFEGRKCLGVDMTLALAPAPAAFLVASLSGPGGAGTGGRWHASFLSDLLRSLDVMVDETVDQGLESPEE